MIKSVYNVLKNGEPNNRDKKSVEANGVQNALNIAFRTAPDLKENETLIVFRRRVDDQIRPLLQLASGKPRAKHNPSLRGWITFKRVGERLQITNFDYCDLGLLKMSCALMNGKPFEAADVETSEFTQRNVAKI